MLSMTLLAPPCVKNATVFPWARMACCGTTRSTNTFGGTAMPFGVDISLMMTVCFNLPKASKKACTWGGQVHCCLFHWPSYGAIIGTDSTIKTEPQFLSLTTVSGAIIIRLRINLELILTVDRGLRFCG